MCSNYGDYKSTHELIEFLSLSPPENGILHARTRFLLLVLILACLSINWANILAFNFTVICMQPADPDTSPPYYRTTPFSSTEKSQATAVAAVGALLANFPIVTLINWYGPRYIFTCLGLVGAVATALIPFSMNIGFGYFLGLRFIQGIAFAGDMATFGHFITYWTYWKQYAFVTATLCVYVQVAPVFSNPISGLFCDSSIGWPGVYYFNSIVTIIVFITFFFCYRNDPNKHPFVHQVEKDKIAEGRDVLNAQAAKSVPYRQILMDPAAWAVFIGSVGDFSAINLIYIFSPTYLSKVQGFQMVETGFFAALPPLLMGIVKELSGLSNDRIPKQIMGETVKTKVYNSFAFLSQALFLIALSFVPEGNGLLALGLMTAGSALLGFNTGGFYKSGSLISGAYAPFVMGQISNGMTITMLIIPLIVNPLTPNNTREEWAHAFYAISAIMIICNIFYVCYASGELRQWAIPTTTATTPSGNNNQISPIDDKEHNIVNNV